MDNMQNLQYEISKWEKLQKQKNRIEIQDIEKNIDSLFRKRISGSLFAEDLSTLVDMEERKNNYIKKEEAFQRLESRALWIQQGDNNTHFFHIFSSYRRNFNDIWEIVKEGGTKVDSLQEIKSEAINYFQNLFSNNKVDDFIQQLEFVKNYPRMIQEDEVNAINSPVTLQEIKDTMSQFSKYKIPGSHGWTSEFFVGFFDLIWEDLLKGLKNQEGLVTSHDL